MKQEAPWITYRPELKVLDCTIRDGGLCNNHQFDDDLVKAVYATCVESGLDYMEIGYRNSKRLFPKDEFGPFRHSDEEDIRKITGDHNSESTGLKLALMADAGKSDWAEDILPCDESVVDMVRIACYVNQIPETVEMIYDAHEKGYETSCNIMAISIVQQGEIDEALKAVIATPVDVICVVDSFGALYREQIEILVRKYLQAVEGTSKEVGIHTHNNQQLAFANTIEAIILGSNRVDATMDGLGRGAGNCPMELLLGFLRNPKFKTRPIYQLLQEYFIPLRRNLEWGPTVPYNITGQHNQHPRSAMAFEASSSREDYVDFYDKIIRDI
ncbi:MAG: 4-hydroxy-2-oxovalerate aldolase [Candidatus Moanabacter tarae]|uniref:4-hydroxy-2-oxovalerate aldolase n=1 Tax=Candidatus Moanibacter tarae TaxID=2200854 RepID=A0A2Z4AE92_9BACT|nr:MAG: 4-hydroxy-2-oxovalerate aldolase [Candidatus Moanabacter tarae]